MKKITILLLSLSLALLGCNKKKDDAKPADDGKKPAAGDVKTPDKPAEDAGWVKAENVKPEDEKIECNYGACKISVVTKSVKEEIEKQKDFEKLEIQFREGVGNDYFKTIANLPWVTKVQISYTKIDTLEPLAKLAKLEELKAASLKWEDDKDNKKRLSLKPLAGLKNLKQLTFYGTHVNDVDALAEAVTLTNINFYMSEVETIKFAEKLVNVEDFDLYACPVTDLAPLANLTKLKKLNLYMNKSTDFSVLAKLPELDDVWLQFTLFADMNLLAGAKKMKSLSLSWLKGDLKDIDAVKNMTELENLSLNSVPVEKIDALAECKKLQRLDLGGTKIKDIKALKELTALTSVTISKTAVADLSPLAKAENLWSLDINGSKVKSLGPIMKLTKLRSLTVSKGFSKGEIAKIKKAMPELNVNER
ncbi:MAG: hypothetical protein CVU65_10550 [Deltaproteobacteria bacterium HGW-Deltaproteobacteria-22]|nr:MAG: hypothetical protein CVU65_10550 [Deltaproteobacteria bacterium HGW-Deltaproteobacteria-22]